MTTTKNELSDLTERMSALTDEMDKLSRHDKLTASQDRRMAELQEEFEMLDERAKAVHRREKLGQLKQSAARGLFEAGSDGTADIHTRNDKRGRNRPASAIRGRALDLIEATEDSSDLTRSTLEAATRWVEKDETPTDAMSRWVLAAGDEDYRSAFAKMLRNPTMGQFEWNDAERAAFGRAQEYQRAMSLTDSAGGYLVPFTLDPAIILTNAGTTNSQLRSAFTVKTIATDAWSGVTSAGVTAEWTAEAAEMADASPTLAQPTIPVYKGDAFVPFSFEAQGDIRGLEAELTPLLADAKNRLEASAFITGTGTGQPRGLITAAVAAGGSTIVASTTADTYAVADIYKVKAALPSRYRENAAWLANEDVWDLTRQFATGTGPQSAFWADFGDGTPSRLLGKPVYETSEMDGSVTASTTNYLLAYGDLKQYYVVDRVGATIELVPHLFGANRRPIGQRGLLLWFRTGGDLVNPAAVRVLNA